MCFQDVALCLNVFYAPHFLKLWLCFRAVIANVLRPWLLVSKGIIPVRYVPSNNIFL